MLLCSRCATISSSDLTVQPNVSPGSVLALDAHALQFVCIMLFMHHRVCSLHFYAWYFMCIKYHMYHIYVYKILFAPNFSFIIKKCTILCTVHITFIPKLTTKNCLYLIPGTRPGIYLLLLYYSEFTSVSIWKTKDWGGRLPIYWLITAENINILSMITRSIFPLLSRCHLQHHHLTTLTQKTVS